MFDPACQYQGVSLNSFLHKGPCLIGNLLGVLLRFREEPIGFVGDISKMYLQIRLPEEDTHFHRFLWRNLDLAQDPTIYALQRVTFGESVSGASELHVFADASGAAYGAVAYLLWPTPHGPEVQLVSAKARVAPLCQITIPRLERMPALIASRRATMIYEEFKTKPASVTLWSDSKIVLHWVRSESALLKAFVGVRVKEIQSMWNPSSWRFVPADLNPADDLSRGLLVEEINGRWKSGPSFLKKSKGEWPRESGDPIGDDPERKKTKVIGAVSLRTPLLEPSAHSSWKRLTRITAYNLRFVHNMKASLEDPTEYKSGPLQPDEIKSERYWILEAQRDLTNWKEAYQDLASFTQDDVVRVGGRLKRSIPSYFLQSIISRQ